MPEFTIDRVTWKKYAERLLNQARNGIVKRRNQKSKRAIGTSNFLENAPTLYIEEDISLYIEAAQAFQICGDWIDAAEAYSQAALMNGSELKQDEEAAILYTEAGLCAMKSDANEGVNYFKKAVSQYCDCNKYDQAGRICKWIAESYEERQQYKEAIEEYKMTMKYFQAKNITYQALNCERKVAYLQYLVGEYNEASLLYKAIGMKDLDYNLTKYNAHNSFFKSALLLLALTIKDGAPYNFANVDDNIKTSAAADFRYEISSSCDFIFNIVNILRDDDISATLDEFVDHLYDYNYLFPLDLCCSDLIEQIMKAHYKDQLECMNLSLNDE